MIIAMVTAVVTSLAAKAPPQEVQDLVEEIRIPSAKAHVSHVAAE